MNAFDQDQHVLQATPQPDGLYHDLLERLRRLHRLDYAGRKASRENPIVARCIEDFADFHLVLERHIVYPALGSSLPLEIPAHALLGHHAGRKIRIADEENFTRDRVSLDHLPDDSIWSHYRHSPQHPGDAPAVYKHHM